MTRVLRLLGVAEEEPLDVYRLLGLTPGEPDPAKIHQALNRSRRILESLIGGPDTAESRRLLEVVDRAGALLTDPARKRAFDEKLRGRIGAVEAVVAPNPDDPGRAAPTPVETMVLTEDRANSAWRWRALAALISIVSFCLGSWSMLAPARFPKHRAGVPAVEGSELAAARMPPAPPRPTMAGLPIGVPRRVAGLEQVRDASGPSLSSDLKTIVYSAGRRGGADADLFLADREGTEQPFGAPSLIPGCDTEHNDYSPSLAGDGLELAFLRGDRPHVMIRPSRRSNFESPEPLEVRGLGGVKLGPFDALQLSEDGLTLIFRAGAGEKGPGNYQVASRRARSNSFGPARPLIVWHPWAFNAFSSGIF